MDASNNTFNVTDVQLRRVTIDRELDSAVEDKLIELQAERRYEILKNISLI